MVNVWYIIGILLCYISFRYSRKDGTRSFRLRAYSLISSEFKCVFQAQPFLIFIAEIQWCAIIQLISFCTGCALIFADEMRPLDTNFWVIPGHAAFVVGMPEIVDFVAKFSYIAEDQKTMGKAFRNEELLFVFIGQFHAIPFAIGL